mgnify:CR=1 FL=1
MTVEADENVSYEYLTNTRKLGTKTESYRTEVEDLSSPLYAYHTLSEIEKAIYNGETNSEQ